MNKYYVEKAKEFSKKVQSKFKEIIEETKPIIDKSKPYLSKGLERTKAGAKKISMPTKVGTAVGGTIGLIAAGTGGMGIVAMGGAVGLPVALVTALVGAGVGSRYGAALKNDELTKKLEAIADDRSAEGLDINENDDFVERILGREAHFKALNQAIESATNTLCIRSGWISNSVVDKSLHDKFKKAIDHGVTIYIESGWRKKGEKKALETKFNSAANEILKKLILYSHNAHENDPKTNIGRIFIGDVPTHIKEIVVDSEYYVSGSNNWLSGVHSNLEASHIIRLPQIAREIRDETILSVRTHLSVLHGSNT